MHQTLGLCHAYPFALLPLSCASASWLYIWSELSPLFQYLGNWVTISQPVTAEHAFYLEIKMLYLLFLLEISSTRLSVVAHTLHFQPLERLRQEDYKLEAWTAEETLSEKEGGGEEKAQQSRAFIGLGEYRGSVLSTHIGQLTTSYNSSCKESDPLFWLPWTFEHLWCTYVHLYPHAYTKKVFFKRKQFNGVIFLCLDYTQNLC